MAKRYFNWPLLIVLVVAAVVLAVSAYAMHSWQKNARAERALPLGEAAYDAGSWDEAARLLGRYLSVYNDRADVMLQYGKALMNHRPMTSSNVDQARRVYASILLNRQADVETAREAAIALIELDMQQRRAFADAISTARDYLEKDNDPTVRRLLGSALNSRKQWAEAAQVFSELIEDDPGNVLAYEAMGQLAEGHPEDVNEPADVWFDEAVRRNPDSALAYIIRADAFLRRDDPNRALSDLQQAQLRDLSDTQVRLRLVASLANAGEMGQARDHLRIVRAETPDDPLVYQTWAAIALVSNDTDEMVAVAQAGLEGLAKQPWDFMPVAAELYIRAGKMEEAGRCVERMREKDVFPEGADYLAGRIAFEQGHVQAAINYWVSAVGLGYDDRLSFFFTSSPPVRMALAEAYEQSGDLDSAIRQMRSLISEKSELNDPRAILMQVTGDLYLGRLLIEAEDWEGAMDAARRARILVPSLTAASVLQLQARISQLIADGASPDDSNWQDIEAQLRDLTQRPGESFVAGLLRVRVARGQQQYANAERLLDELERNAEGAVDESDAGTGYPRPAQIARERAQLYVDEADHAFENGHSVEDAIAVLSQAVDAFPQAPDLTLDLARLLWRQGNEEEAEAVVVAAMDRIQQPRERRRLGLSLASFYAAWGQEAKRYEWLQKLAQQYPSDIQIRRNLLSVPAVLDDAAEAQRLVDEIKTIEGDRGWQWRLEQARVWMQPAYSDNKEAFRRRYADIVGLLQENVQSNPEDISSRLLLGQAYDLGNDLKLALGEYEDLLAREPDSLVLIARTVDALIRDGRADEAERILDDADRRNLHHPDFVQLRYNAEVGRVDMSRDSQERAAALGKASDILEGMVAESPGDDLLRVRLVMLLLRQERFAEAQDLIDDLKASDPNAVYTRTAQIELYIQQGDAEKAIELSNEMVAQLDSALAYWIRARAYAQFDRADEALDDLTRAIELEPQTPLWWFARADYCRRSGRPEQAIADARKTLALAPHSLNAQQLAVELLINSGSRSDLREAQGILNTALADSPQDLRLGLLQARLLLTTQTVAGNQEARRALTALTRSHPDSVEAWLLLGRLDLAEGKPGTAIDLAMQGLERVPNDPSLLLLKADAEFQRSPAVAVSTLKSLAEKYPRWFDVTRRLALAEVESGDSAAALEVIKSGLANLEGSSRQSAEMILAPIMYRAGDTVEAKSILSELSRARPDDPAPLVIRAELLRTEQDWGLIGQLVSDWCAGHPDDIETPTRIAGRLIADGSADATGVAEQILRGVLQRHPDSIAALQPLSILLLTTGRGDESAQLNRTILNVDPNDVVAANNLAWYLAEDQGRYADALGYTNAGLVLAPDYTDLRDTRGVIYYRMGRYEDAVADLMVCTGQYSDSNPAATGAWFHLGRTYVALGDRDNARAALESALRLNGQIGGLTSEDLAEANRLLTQLQGDQQ